MYRDMVHMLSGNISSFGLYDVNFTKSIDAKFLHFVTPSMRYIELNNCQGVDFDNLEPFTHLQMLIIRNCKMMNLKNLFEVKHVSKPILTIINRSIRVNKQYVLDKITRGYFLAIFLTQQYDRMKIIHDDNLYVDCFMKASGIGKKYYTPTQTSNLGNGSNIAALCYTKTGSRISMEQYGEKLGLTTITLLPLLRCGEIDMDELETILSEKRNYLEKRQVIINVAASDTDRITKLVEKYT